VATQYFHQSLQQAVELVLAETLVQAVQAALAAVQVVAVMVMLLVRPLQLDKVTMVGQEVVLSLQVTLVLVLAVAVLARLVQQV
jgi:hypothetical protein